MMPGFTQHLLPAFDNDVPILALKELQLRNHLLTVDKLAEITLFLSASYGSLETSQSVLFRDRQRLEEMVLDFAHYAIRSLQLTNQVNVHAEQLIADLQQKGKTE